MKLDSHCQHFTIGFLKCTFLTLNFTFFNETHFFHGSHLLFWSYTSLFLSVSSQKSDIFWCKNTSLWSVFVKKWGFTITDFYYEIGEWLLIVYKLFMKHVNKLPVYVKFIYFTFYLFYEKKTQFTLSKLYESLFILRFIYFTKKKGVYVK